MKVCKYYAILCVKPALGSNFIDSYSRSSACNGWTWIFDGFTNWSASLISASLSIALCVIEFSVEWLWCGNVSFELFVACVETPSKIKNKKQIKNELIGFNGVYWLYANHK